MPQQSAARHFAAMRLLLPVLLIPALSGCVVGTVAKTAVDVATLPVKVVSAGVDAATTSQSEADEKRGRELREADERLGHEQRKWEAQCRKLTAAGRTCPPPPSSAR